MSPEGCSHRWAQEGAEGRDGQVRAEPQGASVAASLQGLGRAAAAGRGEQDPLRADAEPVISFSEAASANQSKHFVGCPCAGLRTAAPDSSLDKTGRESRHRAPQEARARVWTEASWAVAGVPPVVSRGHWQPWAGATGPSQTRG